LRHSGANRCGTRRLRCSQRLSTEDHSYAKKLRTASRKHDELLSAARLARKLKNVVLFTGAAPAGSTLITRVCGDRRETSVILHCRPRTTVHKMIRELSEALGLGPSSPGLRRTSAELYERLGTKFKTGRILLVVCEADRLTDSGFGLLRALYNDFGVPALVLANENSAHLVRRMLAKHLAWRAVEYPRTE
jgi:hypothetical protein